MEKDGTSIDEIVPLILITLGKGYEHVRPDRDNFVHILWKNIVPGEQYHIYLTHIKMNQSLAMAKH